MLVKRGCDDVIDEAIFHRHVVKLLSEYYIDNINALSSYGIIQDFIMFVDDIGDESSTTTAHNPIGNTDSTFSIPQRQ